jgi:hypothetical protein
MAPIPPDGTVSTAPVVESLMRRASIGLSLCIVLAGCAWGGTEGQGAPNLTEQYDCGFGFYAGNTDQTVGLIITYADFAAAQNGNVPETSQLTDEVWQAELQFGSDLFSNWCDDVLEPFEPTPEVTETWHVSGKIEIVELPSAGQGGAATALLTGMAAQGPDGETLSLDDMEIVNEFWGTFAG